MSRALVTCMLFHIAHANMHNFVKFEADAGDAVKPKQPLLLADRGGRFLRFDTKDTEIELELGVSVPFLKIPLAASVGGGEVSGPVTAPVAGPPDHRVSVNPAGLLVGATILFSSFLLVPWVLPGATAGVHRKRTVDEMTYGDGGRASSGTSLWSVLEVAENLLRSQNVHPKSCLFKSMCYIGEYVHTEMPPLYDNMLRFEMVRQLADSTGIVNVIRERNCDNAYAACMISRQALSLIPQFINFW